MQDSNSLDRAIFRVPLFPHMLLVYDTRMPLTLTLAVYFYQLRYVKPGTTRSVQTDVLQTRTRDSSCPS